MPCPAHIVLYFMFYFFLLSEQTNHDDDHESVHHCHVTYFVAMTAIFSCATCRIAWRHTAVTSRRRHHSTSWVDVSQQWRQRRIWSRSPRCQDHVVCRSLERSGTSPNRTVSASTWCSRLWIVLTIMRHLSPIHTADADATQLTSWVASASAVCTEFATSSRRLSTDLAEKIKLNMSSVESSWVVSGGVYSSLAVVTQFSILQPIRLDKLSTCSVLNLSTKFVDWINYGRARPCFFLRTEVGARFLRGVAWFLLQHHAVLPYQAHVHKVHVHHAHVHKVALCSTTANMQCLPSTDSHGNSTC